MKEATALLFQVCLDRSTLTPRLGWMGWDIAGRSGARTAQERASGADYPVQHMHIDRVQAPVIHGTHPTPAPPPHKQGPALTCCASIRRPRKASSPSQYTGDSSVAWGASGRQCSRPPYPAPPPSSRHNDHAKPSLGMRARIAHT
eukprot:TRINITY_DN7040_c0_g1_i3.p1 TRINITY_DN7040_c0_g1~~TRINITY_DN7040_c0_g1_i3.p1  ORF type:complete len:145 (-),score=3.12 TRINITY_DN7040_c0_g1_i3:87-521(-)